eukprot:TRINITY_DN2027_c0_g1_i1.p1 TRINITY_DN2027_c0_g1~~TRINITY_DN2027_c0_g1_i1.p1  ORF type:complete len:175 (-),score=19.98 TRINITY_DN2027_c0_g1_i1:336-839(-)
MPLFEKNAPISTETLQTILNNHYAPITLGDIIKESQNNTYHAENPQTQQRYVVRVTSNETHDNEVRIQSELALIDYVHERGLSVCPAIKRSDDVTKNYVVEEGLVVVVFVYADGEPITDYVVCDWMKDQLLWEATGRWFGEFHQLSKGFQAESDMAEKYVFLDQAIY